MNTVGGSNHVKTLEKDPLGPRFEEDSELLSNPGPQLPHL